MPRERDIDPDDLIDLELHRAKRPVIGGPVASPTVERVGLGYVGSFPGEITIKVTHLRESRDEFTGELTITCPVAGTVNGTLFWGRFNLMSGTTRGTLAKSLTERVNADWRQFLELFCIETVRLQRMGDPIEFTDGAAPPAEISYLLPPLLPLGLVTTFYGRNGIGKSTLAAAIAVSVETGAEVFPGWTPLSAPTLMLDWEADRGPWEQRCNALARGVGRPVPRMAYRNMRRRLVDDVEYLSEQVAKLGVGLVVVDSVGPAFGTGREGADAAEPVLQAFEGMRQIGGGQAVTWLLIDHITGGDSHNGDADKAYGSIYKSNLVRQAWLAMGAREEQGEQQEVILKHRKSNYSRLLPPQGITIARPDPARIVVRLSDDLESPELASNLSAPQRLVGLLRQGSHSPDYLRQELDLKPSHFRVTVKRALETGLIIKLPNGELGLPR